MSEIVQINPDGIVAAPAGFEVGGYFDVEHFRMMKSGQMKKIGETIGKNIVVDEGLNHILNVTFSDGTNAHTSNSGTYQWFVGIFEANYTPLSTDTAANIASNSTESTAYDESVRQTHTTVASTAESVTNSASKATFTMNATKTIYGAFLISNSTKGGTTGVLLCASKFAASRAVVATDSLLITYNMTAADA